MLDTGVKVIGCGGVAAWPPDKMETEAKKRRICSHSSIFSPSTLEAGILQNGEPFEADPPTVEYSQYCLAVTGLLAVGFF